MTEESKETNGTQIDADAMQRSMTSENAAQLSDGETKPY